MPVDGYDAMYRFVKWVVFILVQLQQITSPPKYLW